MRRRQESRKPARPHVMEREWMSIVLPLRALEAEELEERVMACRADPEIAARRQVQDWTRARGTRSGNAR